MLKLQVTDKPNFLGHPGWTGDLIQGKVSKPETPLRDAQAGLPESVPQINSTTVAGGIDGSSGSNHPDNGLDPQIAQVVAGVKHGSCSKDHPTAQFLAHLGFLDKGKIAEMDLRDWLTDHDANDFESFCRLRQRFIEDPKSVSRTELINLPMISLKTGMRFSVVSSLERELDGYFQGQLWLITQSGIGEIHYDIVRPRSEIEIRARLEAFMKEHGLHSFQDAIAAAKRLDEQARRSAKQTRGAAKEPHTTLDSTENCVSNFLRQPPLPKDDNENEEGAAPDPEITDGLR